jgi:TolB-like protein
MGDDEEGTVRTLTAYREIMTGLIEQYRGRVVDSPGDNLLAEFNSVVDAVQCAVEVQQVLRARNAALPENRRMLFRMGVNLGDVIEEGERIYGDGVNIAARLESMAEGGGICISGSAYDQIKNKLALGYDYLGEHEVKNITDPVRVYKTQIEPTAKKTKLNLIRQRWVALTIVIILVIGVGALGWYQYFRPSVEPASVDKMAFALPDKPSIAVLPFNNMSDDPKQEYFADGITEDLITDLSQISGLFVIARNSTFIYKGKPIKIRRVAEELGVRYVLEGSVRKAGGKVRINTQLIDATTGHHLWAKRYDGRLDDIFSLQDKITQKIVSALAIKLTASKQDQIARNETDNFEAYDTFLKGWGHYLRTTREDFTKAISYFEKAIELDPNYGRAYAALALTYWNTYSRRYTGILNRGMPVEYDKAHLGARKYLNMAMKKPTSIAYQTASEIDLSSRRWDDAIDKAKEATKLDPNDASAYLVIGRVLAFCGRLEEAAEYARKAMRFDPHNPARALGILGLIAFGKKQYDETVTLIERSYKHNPYLAKAWDSLNPPILSAAYAYLGRDTEAHAILASGFSWGLFSPRRMMWRYPFMHSKDAEHFFEGLIKAGVRPPHDYYKTFVENRLNGKEIKAIIIGKKAVGVDGIINRSTDGQSTFRGFPLATDKGKSWVDDDMLCDQWQTRLEGLEGMKICYPVFRNPDGSHAKTDEYIYYRVFKPLTFSLVD